jgi:hypothetical protein
MQLLLRFHVYSKANAVPALDNISHAALHCWPVPASYGQADTYSLKDILLLGYLQLSGY